jgi:hypothetical protein
VCKYIYKSNESIPRRCESLPVGFYLIIINEKQTKYVLLLQNLTNICIMHRYSVCSILWTGSGNNGVRSGRVNDNGCASILYDHVSVNLSNLLFILKQICTINGNKLQYFCQNFNKNAWFSMCSNRNCHMYKTFYFKMCNKASRF